MLARRIDGLAGLLTQAQAASVLDNGQATGAMRPPRVLLLCNLFTLPYRVMRCISETGANVHVLGNVGARGFRFSRYVTGFTHTERAFDGTFETGMADEVNACIERLDIDMVMAGDQPSARSLIGMRPVLKARVFPMPELDTFDLLNDKWSFFQLCQRIGVRCPPTTLYPDIEALRRDLDSGAVTLPLVAKPLSLDGSRGVVILRQPTAARDLETIRYSPILVQHFIDGADIGASAYCDNGEMRAFILHRLARATYTAFSNPEVLDAVGRIARATSYTGVFNFDMRLSPDGTVYFLECNPRFYYKMSQSMLAGVNFVSYGLDTELAPRLDVRSQVRMEKAFFATLPTPWRLRRQDWAMMRHLYSDPLPYIREWLHIDWEDRSY